MGKEITPEAINELLRTLRIEADRLGEIANVMQRAGMSSGSVEERILRAHQITEHEKAQNRWSKLREFYDEEITFRNDVSNKNNEINAIEVAMSQIDDLVTLRESTDPSLRISDVEINSIIDDILYSESRGGITGVDEADRDAKRDESIEGLKAKLALARTELNALYGNIEQGDLRKDENELRNSRSAYETAVTYKELLDEIAEFEAIDLPDAEKLKQDMESAEKRISDMQPDVDAAKLAIGESGEISDEDLSAIINAKIVDADKDIMDKKLEHIAAAIIASGDPSETKKKVSYEQLRNVLSELENEDVRVALASKLGEPMTPEKVAELTKGIRNNFGEVLNSKNGPIEKSGGFVITEISEFRNNLMNIAPEKDVTVTLSTLDSVRNTRDSLDLHKQTMEARLGEREKVKEAEAGLDKVKRYDELKNGIETKLKTLKIKKDKDTSFEVNKVNISDIRKKVIENGKSKNVINDADVVQVDAKKQALDETTRKVIGKWGRMLKVNEIESLEATKLSDALAALNDPSKELLGLESKDILDMLKEIIDLIRGRHRDYHIQPGFDDISVTPEPAKPEPAKPGPAKPEPAKPGPAKPEPAKPEPAKPEPAKPGPAKPEPAKPGPAKPEPAIPETTNPNIEPKNGVNYKELNLKKSEGIRYLESTGVPRGIDEKGVLHTIEDRGDGQLVPVETDVSKYLKNPEKHLKVETKNLIKRMRLEYKRDPKQFEGHFIPDTNLQKAITSKNPVRRFLASRRATKKISGEVSGTDAVKRILSMKCACTGPEMLDSATRLSVNPMYCHLGRNVIDKDDNGNIKIVNVAERVATHDYEDFFKSFTKSTKENIEASMAASKARAEAAKRKRDTEKDSGER